MLELVLPPMRTNPFALISSKIKKSLAISELKRISPCRTYQEPKKKLKERKKIETRGKYFFIACQFSYSYDTISQVIVVSLHA